MYQPIDSSFASVNDASIASAPLGAVPKRSLKKFIKKAISNQNQKCEFMDIAADFKYFPIETEQVLDFSDSNLQSIFEYIQITNFEIDQFMLDKFWQRLRENSFILIDTAVLEWLGYDHEQERDRKASFLKLLKSNEINFKQIKHNDPDFDQYPEFVAEAAQLSVAALKRQKWVILDAQDFKMVVFNLKTKRAKLIHRYYLSLERLMAMYAEYTHHFKLREERKRASQEKDRLIKMMEELKLDNKKAREEARLRHEEAMSRGDALLHHAEQAEEDRMVMMRDINDVRNIAAPEPGKPENLHRMAIVKMSPNYEWDEKDKKYLKKVDAIAVRIQMRDYNNRIKEIKRYGKGTNKDAKVLISFDSPNPVRLYNKLKHEHTNEFTFIPPVGICFEPSTEENLIEVVRNMHEARMAYPNKK